MNSRTQLRAEHPALHLLYRALAIVIGLTALFVVGSLLLELVAAGAAQLGAAIEVTP